MVRVMASQASAASQRVTNWDRNWYVDNVVEVSPNSVEELQEIVRDHERYPSPLKPYGSGHSQTDCMLPDEGGTVIRMRNFRGIALHTTNSNRVICGAGEYHYDVATFLHARQKQLPFSPEIGNITMGSAACSHTKDSDILSSQSNSTVHTGQMSHFCKAVRVVKADGSLQYIDDTDEIMTFMRSSFGLLGIIYEVEFEIMDLQALHVRHEVKSTDEFLDSVERGDKFMYYCIPGLNNSNIILEYRTYYPAEEYYRRGCCNWFKLRNRMWKKTIPILAYLMSLFHFCDCFRDRLIQFFLLIFRILGGNFWCWPVDQVVKFPSRAPWYRYMFSIHILPIDKYREAFNKYLQVFRQRRKNGKFVPDMMTVGYGISAIHEEGFNCYEKDVFTIDPVSTSYDFDGWMDFLSELNEAMAEFKPKITFGNQTPGITHKDMVDAFGKEKIENFLKLRKECDPQWRLYSSFYRNLLEGPK